MVNTFFTLGLGCLLFTRLVIRVCFSLAFLYFMCTVTLVYILFAWTGMAVERWFAGALYIAALCISNTRYLHRVSDGIIFCVYRDVQINFITRSECCKLARHHLFTAARTHRKSVRIRETPSMYTAAHELVSGTEVFVYV